MIVDSGEHHIFDTLDLMGVSYETEEIKLYFCKECEEIYREKVEKCSDCGSTDIEHERVADIIIVNENGEWICAIEAKRGEDLYSSLDDRIYSQMERLAKYMKGNVAVFFEGDLEEIASNHPERAGQIRSIPATCMQYGVSFINTKHTSETIKQLKYFLDKSGQPPKMRTKRFHYYDLIAKNQLMFMAIKGVGLKLSVELAKKYKSITDYGIDIRTRGAKAVAKDIPGLGEKGVKNHSEWIL